LAIAIQVRLKEFTLAYQRPFTAYKLSALIKPLRHFLRPVRYFMR